MAIFKFNYIKTNQFNRRENGIQIIETNDYAEIYNDPFCTVPLFIAKNNKDELFLFSSFKDFYA